MWLSQSVTYSGSLVHHLKNENMRSTSPEFYEGKISIQHVLTWPSVASRQMLGSECHQGGVCSGWTSTLTQSSQPPHSYEWGNSGRQIKRQPEGSRWSRGWSPSSSAARPSSPPPLTAASPQPQQQRLRSRGPRPEPRECGYSGAGKRGWRAGWGENLGEWTLPEAKGGGVHRAVAAVGCRSKRLGKDVSGGCDPSECGQFSLESGSEGRERVVSS